MTFSTMMTELSHEAPYELQSIAQAMPPLGSDGTWFRYIIKQGTSSVTGVRSGTASEVQYFVHDMIERLNERRRGKIRPRVKP